MDTRGFQAPSLDPEAAGELSERARRLRGAVLTMTSVAASGHPGGSLSSLETYLLLWNFANVDPAHPEAPARDRIVVSHGHTSPGVYAVLGERGFFDLDDAIAHFRQAGSPFEGHVERSVPGVEWSSGNLGQGLSAGVGFALGARLTGLGWHTFVAMSDGEQHKGQVAEARRLATKERLSDLTVVVDLNGIQISGHTADVMPVRVADDYRADGWSVLEVDGHDIPALYQALAAAVADKERPTAVIAHTTIGKGVSFMEGQAEYHGRGLTREEYARAMAELGLADRFDHYRALRAHPPLTTSRELHDPRVDLAPGKPREYAAGTLTDNRSAWGSALTDLASANPSKPMAVLDCDLAVSVKTDALAAARPASFVECGVGEHNAATVAGALSITGVATYWADFGVFGVDEVFNQQRLNDINSTNVKLVLTHCGLDVGEDGKTHQCLDYVGAFRNLFGWKVVVPADPNQTDRSVRSMSTVGGNIAIALGRSKAPVIAEKDGSPLFGGDYEFVYGAVEWVREGDAGTVLVMGTPVHAALTAADVLAGEGVHVAVGIVSTPLEIDKAALKRAAQSPWVLCVEDHHWRTGLWATVAESAARAGGAPRILPHGVDAYRSSGSASDVLASAGLDASGIAEAIRRLA
ncbi:MAG: transketolase [Actinomycetia bacterium]|nr:transketolase [Actinomycetes bacterium]